MGCNTPLVSIIIPVYNGSNYVREAIDSAINQTYKNCEVIVVNDGSTDNGETEKIAKSYGERIRYYHKTNGGVSSALNFGIDKMKGTYFSWLSHDDVYEVDKVEKQINLLNKYGKEDIIGLCEIKTIDKDSKEISSVQRKRNLSTEKINNWKDALNDLLINGSFYGCALLIPKEAIIKCGGFREDLRYCQDHLMWFKLVLSQIEFVYSSEKLVSLRVHDGQLTQTGRSLYHKEITELAREIVPKLETASNKERNYLYSFSCEMAKYNNSDVVRFCNDIANNKKLFGIKEKLGIGIRLIYGKVRPKIRILYYRFVRGVKTE